jgi:hypothetical protein
MGKGKLEELREKLNKEIESYGRDSPIVLEISRELDLYIVKEMKICRNNTLNQDK